MNNIDSNTGEIVMYQPDETIRLEVRVENETVWLTQQQIADLFQSSRTNVVEHVMHIYEDEELEESSTCRKFRQVRKEGKRTVSRVVPMYNLDMIISVGYRINSKRGVKFRQWANRVLKEYMLNGYSVNRGITGSVLRNHGVGSPDHIQESDISMLNYLSHSHFI